MHSCGQACVAILGTWECGDGSSRSLILQFVVYAKNGFGLNCPVNCSDEKNLPVLEFIEKVLFTSIPINVRWAES